jgi:hypothetical protein
MWGQGHAVAVSYPLRGYEAGCGVSYGEKGYRRSSCGRAIILAIYYLCKNYHILWKYKDRKQLSKVLSSM